MPIKQKTVKIIARILGLIVLIFVFIVGGCSYVFWAIGNGLCGNYIFQEVSSPDHEYKVVVFQRDCGATTGFSTQASILKTSDKLANESGNIFAMDGHPDWTHVLVTWDTSRSVTIKYSGKYAVFFTKSEFRSFFTLIRMKYQSVSDN